MLSMSREKVGVVGLSGTQKMLSTSAESIQSSGRLGRGVGRVLLDGSRPKLYLRSSAVVTLAISEGSDPIKNGLLYKS